MRVFVTLACTECKNRNYHTTKNKKKTERFETQKFCPACRKHTSHKEVNRPVALTAERRTPNP